MALTQCHECGKPVSTEAAACPNCGAPPRQNVATPPAIPAAPSAPPKEDNRAEETLYTDNRVTVTTTRVIIGTTTYALRNITSVKPISTTPSPGCAIILLIAGVLMLAIAMAVFTQDIGGGLVVGVFGAAILGGAILWFRSLKATYHMQIASASGEAKALSSPDRAYVEKVVISVNDAIVKYR